MNNSFSCESLSVFAQPKVATLWGDAMNIDVRRYLEPLAEGRKNGGKMLWWVPIKESQYLGYLKNDITYQQAATLLNEACPGYFKSVDSLTGSFESVNKKERSEQLESLQDQYGPEVRHILVRQIKVQPTGQEAPSGITDIIAEAAEQLVDTCYNRRSSFVRRNELFVKGPNQVSPAVAVVTYPDEQAIRTDSPQSVVSFEVIDGELSPDHVHIYNSKYAPFAGRHHLVLAARSVTSQQAVQLCEEHYIGLCIVNPDGSWKRVLSRTVNNLWAIAAAQRAMFGGCSECRIIAYDHLGFTTLPEMLRRLGACIKSDSLLGRPVLWKEEIKQIAYNRLLEVGCDMNGYYVSNRNLSDVAELLGVRFDFGLLPDYWLELCNLDTGEITINQALITDANRGRFTLGHGFGHYDLQRDCVSPYIYTFGENPQEQHFGQNPNNILRWAEWEANQYSRYLTMPDQIVRNLFERCCDERTRRIGHIFVDDQCCNISSFLVTMRQMSQLAQMSIQALSYRLKDLDLLVDMRTSKQHGAQQLYLSL